MITIKSRSVLGEKLDLNEVKNYLKLSTDVDDDLISKLIDAAYEIFEQYTAIAPITTSYVCKVYSKTGLEPSPRIPIQVVSNEVTVDRNLWLIVPAQVETEFTLVAGYDTTPPAIRESLLRLIAELYYKRNENLDLSFLRRFKTWLL